MKVKTQTVSKILREYKYCSHADAVHADILPGHSPRVLLPEPGSLPPPLTKSMLTPQSDKGQWHQAGPPSVRMQRFPRASSSADRRACCVGCFAKMLDSFINNCS